MFPAGDVAAAKALGSLRGGAALLDRLGRRGMLYYALLARRLLVAGAVG